LILARELGDLTEGRLGGGANPRKLQISLCTTDADAQQWQAFVDSHPECTNYHRWNWKQVIENTFAWPAFYLMAKENGRVTGILPLAFQKNWPRDSFVSSLPVLSAGGIVSENVAAEQELLREAIGLTNRLKAKYLELRYYEKTQLNLPVKTNKVRVVVPVADTPEKMWKALSTKMRTNIRKAESFGLDAQFGGGELLNAFYDVFSENMRDLGTPVYGRNLFSEILHAFPNDTYLCLVRKQGNPVAAAFLTGFREKIEAKWSSSVRKHLSLKPNMFLYWKLLSFASQHGYRVFDFGRSTVGSGTHEFKMRWGSQTLPLHWTYWLQDGKPLPEISSQGHSFQIAIRLWQLLPVPVTRYIGPKIVKYLPS
jgi:serine/alanine adding enzyme